MKTTGVVTQGRRSAEKLLWKIAHLHLATLSKKRLQRASAFLSILRNFSEWLFIEDLRAAASKATPSWTARTRFCLKTYFTDIAKQHDSVYMFKDNNRNTIKTCNTYSKLTIKKTKGGHWRRSSVRIVKLNYSTKVNKKDTTT